MICISEVHLRGKLVHILIFDRIWQNSTLLDREMLSLKLSNFTLVYIDVPNHGNILLPFVSIIWTYISPA